MMGAKKNRACLDDKQARSSGASISDAAQAQRNLRFFQL
jgi:hypothetical protein